MTIAHPYPSTKQAFNMKRKYASSYRTVPRRVRRRVGSVLSTAVGVGSALYRSYTKSRVARKQTSDLHVAHSGPSCTSRVTYRKKRMPARRRKAWKKFTKKVQAVDLVGLPKSTFRTTVLRRWTSGNGNQNNDGILFRPGDGDSSTGCDDVMALAQYTTDALGFNLSGSTASSDRAVKDYQTNGPMISSFIFDLSMSNLLPSTAYVDMYEVVLREDIPSAIINEGALFASILTNHNNFSGTLGGGETSPVTFTRYGMKPFDLKEFCSKLKITKVESIVLPGNGTCKRQWREPRNVRIGPNLYQDKLAKRGDKMLFFTSYGPPGMNNTTQVYSTPSDIVVQATRSYKWCMPGYNAQTVQVRTAGP